MKNLLCFIALIGFVALTLGQINLGDAGEFSHFAAGTFKRAGWQGSGSINAWDTTTSRFNGAGGATWTGGSVQDIAPVGTNGLLAVGDFTGVNGKTAIGIAYYNGSTWCGFSHLHLYRFTPSTNDLTSNPRSQAIASGRAYAVYNNGNDYYIFGGRRNGFTGASAPNFNMVGTTTRTGVAGLLKIQFSNNNFTVDTGAFTYNVRPSGDTTNPATGYPAGQSSAPMGASGSKLRVILDGSTPVFFVQSSSSLRFWRETYNDWVVMSSAAQTLLISGNTQTFTIPTGIPNSNGTVTNFEVTGSTVFVYGSFNNTISPITNQKWLNIAKLTYSNSLSLSYETAYNPSSAFINNNEGNPGVSALALTDATNFFFASGESVQFATPNGVTDEEQRFFVYQVTNGGAQSIVGGSTSARFGNSASLTNQPISRLWLINGNIQAYGSFNLYNFNYDATSRSNTRFTETASGWSQFSDNSWSVVYGGGLTSGGANIVPTKVVVSGNWVYFLAAGATQSYNVYSNGLVGFDDRTHIKKYKTFTYQRLTLRTPSSTGLPVGNDGEVRTVHFLKSQRSGVDDAILIGGQFDWVGTTLLGSAAFLRLRTNTYESVGGGLWTGYTGFGFTGDATVPQFVAGKINDFEEKGNRLYAGGLFNKNSVDQCVMNVARLNFKDTNAVWTQLGPQGCTGEVRDLFIDGSKIYAGGDFQNCGNAIGTRNIAYLEEDDDEWKPLNSGLNGAVHAMIKFGGKLYVGGAFSQVSNIRGSVGGIARWDGSHWDNVLSRCQVDCDVGEFEFPFVSQTDPTSRTASTVSSFKTTGGKLYAQGGVPAGGNLLLQFDGSTWRQLGVASRGSTCFKQGCIATNQSDIIAVGFSNTAQTGYNPNYQTYDPSNHVWEETMEGFDGSVNHISGASSVTFSVVLLFIATIIVIFF